MSFETVAKQVQELIDAAKSLSMAAAGKYVDRPKFKWDLPEVDALRRLRTALKAVGDHHMIGQMIHDESNVSTAHHSGCLCLARNECDHKWEPDGDRDVCKLCGTRAHPVL